jgi:nitrogen regulatory protein PII
MKHVKRVEIIVEDLEKETIINLLKAHHLEHYTLYKHVAGNGERGMREDQVFGEKFENVAIVLACSEEVIAELIESIRPVLKKYGGICLVSDAQWVIH